jgi:hypothetical protein
LEIIDIILRNACKWPLSREERRLLTACTLVCKSWLPLAQCLLYHSVIVKTGRQYPTRIPGTLKPEELLQQPRILELTRSLSIYVRGNSESTATLPLSSEGDSLKGSRKHVQIPEFFSLIAHTPGLLYLKLSVDCAGKNICPFEPHIQDWLSSLTLPIEALNMDVWQFWDLRSTFVYDLVGIWPTIRALHLSTTENHGPLPERPDISLRELRLPFIQPATVLEWFLPPPPPNQQSNLLFLELVNITEEARAVLSVHGHSVSTLALERQPPFEIAGLFPRLEELVIMGPFWRSRLPLLPRTLKHIRLARSLSTGPTVAVTEVVPMLPGLRIISIEEKFTANEHYLDLQKVCEAHGVEILVSSSDSSGRHVVSTYHKCQHLCDICH